MRINLRIIYTAKLIKKKTINIKVYETLLKEYHINEKINGHSIIKKVANNLQHDQEI